MKISILLGVLFGILALLVLSASGGPNIARFAATRGGAAPYYSWTTESDSFISCGTYQNSSNITVCMWVYPNAGLGALQTLADKSLNDGGWDVPIVIFLNANGTVQAYTAQSAPNADAAANSTTTITNLAWHFVCGTIDNNYVSVFVDGVREAQTAWTRGAKIQNSEMTFATTRRSVSALNGSIDEFCVFDRALTTNEIWQIYASGAGTYASTSSAPFNSSLAGGWHVDEGTGTNSTDISGNSRTTYMGCAHVPPLVVWSNGWVAAP